MGRREAAPPFLFVALVEHLQRVPIARHASLFIRVLQAALETIHIFLLILVRGALVQQIEQGHVHDPAPADFHLLADPPGESLGGVLFHDLRLERVVADLVLRDPADHLELFQNLGNVLQQEALNVMMPGLVELFEILADVNLRADRLFLDSVGWMPAEAKPVVFLLRRGVPDDPVGLAGFLETGFRPLVAGMVIGMVLLGQFSKRSLDVGRRRVLLDTQDLVINSHNEEGL